MSTSKLPFLFDARSRRRILARLTWSPAVVLLACAVALTRSLVGLLDEAARGDESLDSITGVIVSAVGFFAGGAALVLIQAARSVRRVEEPVERLCAGLQRLRRGDLAFRLNMRRGDPLQPVAHEVNLLIDWLNQHPPGCNDLRLGGDVIDVAADDEADEDPEGPAHDAARGGANTEEAQEVPVVAGGRLP